MKRASKTTYLTTVAGDITVPFQFSPHELNGAESGNFSSRVRVGGFDPQLIWISGEVRRITIPFFIYRTLESVSRQRHNSHETKFMPLVRFPNQNPGLTSADALALRQGTANASGTQVKEPATFTMTDFDPNPNFPLGVGSENSGVYIDLNLFLHFIRPAGQGITKAQFDKSGEFTILDYAEGRFVPPPLCRFFHGNYWLQGYLSRIDYRLSAMNGSLVPMRMEGNLEFLIEKDGVLTEIK